MSRPTPAGVDAALSSESDWGDVPRDNANILSHEVRALRHDLESELRELSARMLSNAEMLP